MQDFFSSIFGGLFNPTPPEAQPLDVQGIVFRAGEGANWQDEWRFAETPQDLVMMGGPEIPADMWGPPKQRDPVPTTTVGHGPDPLGPVGSQSQGVTRDSLPSVAVPSLDGADIQINREGIVTTTPPEVDLPPLSLLPLGEQQQGLSNDPRYEWSRKAWANGTYGKGLAPEVPTPIPTDRPPHIPPNLPTVQPTPPPRDLARTVNMAFAPPPRTSWGDQKGTPMPGRPLDEKVRREGLGSTKGTWTARDPRWAKLGDHERAAAMALMEADGLRFEDAKNALAAMHNRAAKDKLKLGEHVSTKHYQPTFEPAQQKRLDKILGSAQWATLLDWSKRYAAGMEKDPVKGATHFLAHPKVMLALEAKQPRKYRSWRSWTGFDQAAGTYKNQTVTDKSHAFLAPAGRWSLGMKDDDE